MNTQDEQNRMNPAPADITEEAPFLPAADPTQDTAPMVEIVGVGFRNAGKTYYFSPRGNQVTLGTRVIVETARGVEIGHVTIANRMVPKKETVQPLREIIRVATQNDLARDEENRRLEQHAATVCREKIRQHGLPMDLTGVEYTFDNSKLLFYFTAETRVDFRDLVRDLAGIFKTRIELRQIGIRDEARMMGGFGVCGRPFCCSSFLPDFVQVSIKMAKEQNFSLNSNKISGACGRLMCCLRYEHETYEEALKVTPSVGSYVSTPAGLGTVVEARPLTSEVKIRLDEKGEQRLFTCQEVRVLRSKGKGGLQPDEEAPAMLAAAEEARARAAAAAAADPRAGKTAEERRPRPNGNRREERPRGESGGAQPSAAAPVASNNAANTPRNGEGRRKQNRRPKRQGHGDRPKNEVTAGNGGPEQKKDTPAPKN